MGKVYVVCLCVNGDNDDNDNNGDSEDLLIHHINEVLVEGILLAQCFGQHLNLPHDGHRHPPWGLPAAAQEHQSKALSQAQHISVVPTLWGRKQGMTWRNCG